MKIPSRIITIDRTPIYVGKNALSFVDKVIRSMHLGHDGIYILVDKNTRQYCLPVLLEQSSLLAGARLLEIDGGEDSKTIAMAGKLWNELLASGASRESLLVNLGGGVISDLGGFVAAGYKRGINYLNIPTTLMGQSDAAIGGKTAVNLGNIKNQIGFFQAAKGVFIFPGFLNTLPKDHLRSGMAEIIKCALVGNARLWRRIRNHPVTEILSLPVEHAFWHEMLTSTIKYKNMVVVRDYKENKLRKVLNFGHTIGHALEAYSMLDSRKSLLHGEAVAAGMICAAYLSHKKTGLMAPDMEAITTYLTDGFPVYSVYTLSMPAVMELIIHDKKRQNGQLQFTLISKPGNPVINISCDQEEILEALGFFNATLSG